MAKPTLSAAQRAQMQSELDQAHATKALFDAQGPAQDARNAELTVVDNGFKSLMDWYNDSIIGKYDAEKKALSGVYIGNPVVEADIEEPASLNGAHRTTPTPPITDIVRIDEFDGLNTTTTLINETQHISDQLTVMDYLENGFGGTSPTITATSTTTTDLTSASTHISLSDAVGPMGFGVGNVFAISNGSDAAIVEVTGVTDNLGGDPPYSFTLEIDILLNPSGTIASGSTPVVFSGFTDGERSSKTASDGDLQPVMNALILQLEGVLNDRISRLTEMLNALNANEDIDGTTEIAQAISDTNDTDNFIDNYLLTTDISNVGLASLNAETTSRLAEITARLVEINAAYTGQTENYYDRRYNLANNRGNLASGTLRLLKNGIAMKATTTSLAATAQDTIDSLTIILA